MSDESLPSKNTKNEYLEVKGPANTLANLMRPPIPHVSEMTGTFEKLKQLKEMIAGRNVAKETDEVDPVEDEEAPGEDKTVTITINNTMHGQILTLEDSESEESDSEEVNVINDIDPSKYTMLSDSEEEEEDDDDDVVEIPLNKKNKRSAGDPMIELLSPSDSEESSAIESDSEESSVVEADSPVQRKRQKLE